MDNVPAEHLFKVDEPVSQCYWLVMKRKTPLGTRLSYARMLLGISAKKLDVLAGITVGHTAMIESGHVSENLKVATATKLAKALGTTLEWLVSGTGQGPKAKDEERGAA